MSVPVFLLGEIQCLAKSFYFHVRKCSNFSQFLFGFCCQRLQYEGMDGVGGSKSHRTRDTVIGRAWRDKGRHKEKTGNSWTRKAKQHFERGAQEPQNRAQKRGKAWLFFLIFPFFQTYNTSLREHGWTGIRGGGGGAKRDWERDTWVVKGWKGERCWQQGEEAKEPAEIWIKNFDFGVPLQYDVLLNATSSKVCPDQL